MAYSIQTLLSDLSGVVHGTTINKVPNIYGAINRAARAVLLDVDPKETQRILETPQIFNNVFDYTLPPDLKGDRIIDLRPQAGRTPGDVFNQSYAQTFDRTKQNVLNNQLYIQHNSGEKTIRIEAPTLTAPITISDTGTLTGWSATQDAVDLTLDQVNNVAGSGSLVFNLDGTNTGTPSIQNSTLTSLDLSSHENKSTLFMWVYLPTAADVTIVTLTWGSSVGDYWTDNTSTTQDGKSFQDGWNQLAFTWDSSVGAPDSSTITYAQVSFVYDSTVQTGIKVDSITSALGFIFEIQYYSKYIFRDPRTMTFYESVQDSTENGYEINLDTESYNLLFNKTAFFVAQQLQGADAQYDADYWETEYKEALARYKAQNPSEAIKKTETYYKMPNKGYSRYNPTMWRRG